LIVANALAPDSTPEKPAAEVSAEIRAELAEASRRLESAQPPEIIRWAFERFGAGLTMATAFGPEGCLMLHWIAAVAPGVHVFNLDTGYQFAETSGCTAARSTAEIPTAAAPTASWPWSAGCWRASTRG
jgi:3'-phosphoadenosine 5'-phosphosulfate sulfotransferase (PAPS reductase)/FAD synthetase